MSLVSQKKLVILTDNFEREKGVVAFEWEEDINKNGLTLTIFAKTFTKGSKAGLLTQKCYNELEHSTRTTKYFSIKLILGQFRPPSFFSICEI